jgi:hypothetical protein
MTTAGSNFISGITTTVFNSTDVVNKDYVDANVQPLPSQTGNAGKFLTTTDGTNVSWDYVSNYQEFTSPGEQTFNVPSYSNLLFIEAVGAGGGGSAGQSNATSNQGVTWTLRTSGANQQTYGLVYSGQFYVGPSGGGRIIASTDTITWSLRTAGFTSILYKITYGTSPTGTYLVGGVSGALNTSTDTITWELRTSGTSNTIQYVYYVNNIYFAGGNSGTLLTSTNAIQWTLRTSGHGSANLYDSIYDGVNYYIVGSGGFLSTSTDTISWTLRTSGADGQLWTITYASGNTQAYVIGGDSGKLNTSTNGIEWTLRTAGVGSNRVESVIYANNTYLIVGDIGILNTSTNAIQWTLRTSNTFQNLYHIIYENNTYVFSGNSGIIATSYSQSSGRGGSSGSYTSWYIPKAIVSSNLTINPGVGGAGATTDAATGSAGAGTTVSWTGPGGTYTITASGGTGTAAGEAQLASQSSSFYTTAGLTGASQSLGIGLTATAQTNQFQPTGGGSGGSSNFGDGSTAAGGSGGAISVYGISTSASGGTTSGTNGVIGIAYTGLPYGSGGGGGGAKSESPYWNLRTSGITSNLNSISGVNLYDDIGGYNYYGLMTAGDSGVLSTSTDGLNWTLRTSSFGATAIRASLLTFSLGQKSLIVGDGGNLRTTTNGIQWSTYSSGTANALYAIGPGQGSDDGTWTIGGASGYLASSLFLDLTIWISRTSGFGSNAIYAINFAAQDPFAGPISRSAAGANGTYAYSTDSIVWTLRTTAFGTSAIRGLGNNGFTAVGDDGKIATTTDSIVWTLRTSGTTSQLNSISSGTDPYIVGGINGITLTSTDGIIWISRGSNTTNNINSVYYGVQVDYNTYYAGNSGTIGILKNPLPVGAVGTGGTGARGGGGGGGATNGTSFGSGGNGGDGYVKITWW